MASLEPDQAEAIAQQPVLELGLVLRDEVLAWVTGQIVAGRKPAKRTMRRSKKQGLEEAPRLRLRGQRQRRRRRMAFAAGFTIASWLCKSFLRRWAITALLQSSLTDFGTGVSGGT